MSQKPNPGILPLDLTSFLPETGSAALGFLSAALLIGRPR